MTSSALSRRRTVVSFVAGGAAVVLATHTGLVSAAVARGLPSSSVAGFTACATSHRVLVLSSDGRCSGGTHKVTVGARGPAGPRGKTGASGPTESYSDSATLTGPPSSDGRVLTHSEAPGSYVLAWSVEVEGQSSTPGAPAGQLLYVTLACQPGLKTSSGIQRQGTSGALEEFTVAAGQYDAGTDTSAYTFAKSMTGTTPWTMAKNSSLVISCLATAADQDGAKTISPELWSTQVTLTKVSAVHLQS